MDFNNAKQNGREVDEFGRLELLADYVSDYMLMNARIRDMDINASPEPEILARVQDTPIAREGRPAKEVADRLVQDVFMQAMLTQHPRFFSFVASSVSPYSIAGAVLTDIFNIHGGGWETAPTACLIEEKLVKWMCSRAGYSQDTCGGVFTSGGSMANMSAFIAAREEKLNQDEYPLGVAYISDQTHSSAHKGLRMIGLREDQIVIIDTDENYRMQPYQLKAAIERDIAAGKRPFLVVGSLGTTNTGSIDPFEELADICQSHNMWLHVDGAFGGSLLLSDTYRSMAAGIQRSDSLSWDTHKWAMQVYSSSTLLVRDRTMLLNAFTEHPEYLEDVRNEEHPDLWNLSPEMSRPHRSLKLWMTVQTLGTDALADVVDQAIHRSLLVEELLGQMPDWEVTSPPSCGAITFRYAPAGLSDQELDALNQRISNQLIDSGYAFIVTTQLRKQCVLRMCVINSNTTDEDIRQTLNRLGEIASECQ